MFFIIEKSEETTFNFSQDSVFLLFDSLSLLLTVSQIVIIPKMMK